MKRENIERGVLEVVSRKGLAATTIQDIATASGVSPGLLYRYWENRDQLAGDVYRTHYETLYGRLSARVAAAVEAIERGGSPQATRTWAVLDAMIEEFLRFADEQPVVLRFLLLSQHELLQHIPGERGVRKMLLDLIHFGQAEGAIRPLNPEIALNLILGIALQPVVSACYGYMPTPLFQFHPQIIDALRRALAPTADDLRPASNGRPPLAGALSPR